MDSQFAKILKLIKLTGEKVLVLKDDQEFVVSNLDDYFRLIEGTQPITELSEGQLLDKINRDIALWRESQKELVAKTEDLFEPIEDSGPYYTPLKHSAQAEIDRLNDNIDNEMLTFEDNKEKLSNFSNESKLNEFDFKADFEEDNSFIDENLDNTNNFNENTSEILENIAAEDEDTLSSENNSIWGKSFNSINEDEDNEDNIEEDILEDYEDYKDEPIEDLPWETKKLDVHLKKEKFKEKFIDKFKIKKPKVNNFGYLNPIDTDNDENDAQSLDKEEFSKADFIDIPPPPDVKK